MGKLREFSDKVSDVADKYGLANPIEVVDEALGGQTREESKKRRDEAKFVKDVPMEVMVPDTPKKPVKKAKGGMVGSASKRADGCAIRGKTKGRMM
jgi:hypothetical protein